ncbi:MAG: glycoside hydrolase family 95 protein, partial [Prolixibacteraceae bacterium]|nr:glycoside hydrolase family 95 protein [Prolixibacteraceae bacterium]
MKNRIFSIGTSIVLFIFGMQSLQAESNKQHKLWYLQPASVWNEALPVGNGRLGAMVYGDPALEKIQLNEESFWSGGPSRNDNPAALDALPQVRQLIFDGKYHDVEKLINEKMLSPLHGSMYQSIGHLKLNFPGHEQFSQYHRELDLEQALFSTRYTVNGTTFHR